MMKTQAPLAPNKLFDLVGCGPQLFCRLTHVEVARPAFRQDDCVTRDTTTTVSSSVVSDNDDAFEEVEEGFLTDRNGERGRATGPDTNLRRANIIKGIVRNACVCGPVQRIISSVLDEILWSKSVVAVDLHPNHRIAVFHTLVGVHSPDLVNRRDNVPTSRVAFGNNDCVAWTEVVSRPIGIAKAAMAGQHVEDLGVSLRVGRIPSALRTEP